ncbi:hypothetical protein [Vibrio crassostreae]|uniref:hypothetical protein n=1 Tax=Vibrio crassostreae TaxID=246167 RepID=UPI000F474CCC|nr:hypothetical protein [Vibrio crassostreae]ROR27003.1 hypothetical protein EDB67_102422 [Vibrio crassostreae]TCV22425.1 hypothetical protein EDB71_11691 [Vibrio crassostreae]
MQTNNYQKQAMILFALLTIGSAFVNTYGMNATIGEQLIAFISSLISYIVIVSLFLRFANVDVINSKYRTLIGASFVCITILENVYPMVIFSSHALTREYYVIFSIKLVVNSYVANVIVNEINVLGQFLKAPLLDSILIKIKARLDSKADASRVYKKLYPVLEVLLEQGYSFDSQEVSRIVNVLGELPASGTKRKNFANLYLRDEITLRKLPRDPSYFDGQALWH